MKGHILRYGVDDRDHLVHFLNGFYRKNAKDEIVDDKMTPQVLGKNWSAYLYERRGKNFLVMFDADDDSGGTPADCKLVWPRFQNLLTHYDVQDYLIFKVQHTSIPEHREFYPFKTDVYPLGLTVNFPKKIYKLASELKPVTQDIDVLFVGGKVHDHNYPYCWPKHRSTTEHWPTNRRIGYAKLLEIKERRKDLNIVAVDGLMEPNQYYAHVNRAKVCLDFPGVGVSSRKFYEFMVLGKCVVALQQQNACWPLRENEHYISLGRDYEYKTLESRIDFALQNTEARQSVEAAARSLQPLMTHEAVAEYVERTVDAHIDAWFAGTLERVTYK